MSVLSCQHIQKTKREMLLSLAIITIFLILPLSHSVNAKEGKQKLNFYKDSDVEQLSAQWDQEEEDEDDEDDMDKSVLVDKPLLGVDLSKLDAGDPNYREELVKLA